MLVTTKCDETDILPNSSLKASYIKRRIKVRLYLMCMISY